MRLSYEGLTDKSGIDSEALKFKGFDGNNEWLFGCFVDYLKKIGRWTEPPSDYMNTDGPTKHRYRLMVDTFKAINAKHGRGWDCRMTKKEIQSILTAGCATL
jgi:uncharacterized protein YfbU (UPF0304 family)